MHGPPAVACRFSRSPQPAFHLVVVGCLTLITLGGLGSSTFQWTWLGWALLAFYVNAQAWFLWWRSAQGDLQWDGDQWHWTSWTRSPACSVDWVYDFQTWGLVRIENEKRQSQWLWLHKGATDDVQWQAIRRALLATRAHVQGVSQHNATSASY